MTGVISCIGMMLTIFVCEGGVRTGAAWSKYLISLHISLMPRVEITHTEKRQFEERQPTTSMHCAMGKQFPFTSLSPVIHFPVQ